MTISPLSNTNISATEKLNNKKLQSQNLPQISIIVPVFNSLEFLEDCLDSIYSSSPNIKIEVLVGIDSSSDDLKWFEQNHQKYNNLHVFWFNQNVGPYVIKNTLVDFAKSDNILFFDSDDIMNKNMISNYFNNIKNNLIVRFKYIEFTTKSELNNKSVSRSFADSVFGIRKSTFNKLNGFESWKSSADVEFHYRVKAHKISSKNLEFALFYKRIHKDSLSLKLNQDNKTVRQEYIGLLNKKLRLKNWNLHSKKTASCLKVEDYSSPLNLSTSLTNTHSAIVNKSFKLQHSKPASNINNSKVFNTKTDNNINKENNLSKLTVSSSDYISIIIPAFKASEFLDDCLTSITNQSFKNIEILIGIDACQETLDWALNNKHKYPNVSFFYFDTNEGPYIIKNTLANIASHDNILFFDADDLMEKDLLVSVVQYMKNNTIVKIKCCDFAHSKGIKSASKFKWFGEGVFAIKKQDFIKLKGFEPWKCAADTEFQLRARFNNFKIVNSNSSFYRRIHSNNLTVHHSTNGRSELRKNYIQKINEKQKNKFWNLADFKTANFKKIFIEPNDYKDFIDITSNDMNMNSNNSQTNPILLNVSVYHFIPWSTNKNLGEQYNQCMSLLKDEDWACFLDGDAVHTTTYFGKYIEQIVSNNPEYGLFTCYTNRIGCSYQMPGNYWENDSQAYHRNIGEKLWKQHQTNVLDITNKSPLSGVLILIKKEQWSQVGGFKEDKMLSIDNDIHLRFKNAGFKVGLMQGIYVQHWYRNGKQKEKSHLL